MLRSDKSGFSFTKLMRMRIPLMAMLLIASICAATLLFGTVNTFTVTDGETVVNGVYTLGAYINALEANGEDASLARAYYAYSLASLMYKTYDPDVTP